MKITSYKKDGKTLYKFNAYLGKDPLTGKEIRTNRQGFSTKREAEFAYLALKSQQEQINKPKQYTFEEVYNLWFEEYKKTVSGATLRNTKRIFENHILQEIGKIFIDKINLTIAQNAVNTWSEKAQTYKSFKRYAEKVVKHAIKLELMEKNPFEHVTMPKSTAPKQNLVKKSENFYDKNEMLKFLEYAKQDLSAMWYTFFRLMAYTGMRRGEVLALTWQDVDFKLSTVTVNKTLTLNEDNKLTLHDRTKTDAGEREIILDSETLSTLKKWKQEQIKTSSVININQIIFPNQKNSYFALSTPIKKMNSVCSKHNLRRITQHGLRHTHCSILFEAGATIKEVQDRIGHQDVKTTLNVYTHLNKEQKQNTVDRFSEFMQRNN